MKTLIVGMGNVGVMHGWMLSQAGFDITHVVRKGASGRFAGGVKMDVLDMRGDALRNYQAVYQPKLVEDVSPADGYELVIVATNHLQVTDAVRQYRHLAANSDFLLFAGNWKGPGEIDALIPRSRYLWGFSVASGARGKDGVLYANLQKTYRIGELDGSRSPRLEKIIKMFGQAGLAPDLKSNIIEWLWIHFATDAGVLGVALSLSGLPPKDAGLETWVLMIRAVKDALAVLEKRGVKVGTYPDAKLFLLPDVEEAARKFRQIILGMPHYERTRTHSHFDTSPEEMRCLCLDVLETGEQLGVPMPALGSLKGIICPAAGGK